MKNPAEIFACNVFNDEVMKNVLPKTVYNEYKNAVSLSKTLSKEAADVIAEAMKIWALSKGATHFTHWFQPMTGITAEKHDSFLATKRNGSVVMEFSGKELVHGEPDASSFPSGGLRTTFEARGYTVWDPTSYAFIKDKCLYIPTAFCSYDGEALDKKTPLLRSMEAISKQATRILKLFGSGASSVKTTVGPEQEYFLVDKKLFEKRKDLMYTGRTLFGANPPKGQELDDHYFGSIKPRVQAFMNELNEELWKLGVPAKTEHNEVAPAQHELAPIFSTTNIATDYNQITMELMKKIADKHGMVCLLHEKPFDGVNGSGKHNNWSMSTDTGVNLLEPGDTPEDNAQFLLFLTAVIKAVDEYQDLLRLSVASAGNDHRLGANEAPPAIVSMFLGDELDAVLKNIAGEPSCGKVAKTQMEIGVDVLPKFPKDSTDRNRTSPFAFTGNKFEFRMLGSSESIAGANIMLNTAVAEELRQFADELENAEDFHAELNALIRKVIRRHSRIIFNGNGYDDSWIAEAERRGLLNLKTTPDALPAYIAEKNIRLFTLHKVFTEAEVRARYEILNENYAKTLHIEAVTMIKMISKDILPAVSAYSAELAKRAAAKKALNLPCEYEAKTAWEVANEETQLKYAAERLSALVAQTEELSGYQLSLFYRDEILPAMAEARRHADDLEKITAREYWPYPTYGDLLFSVR